MAKLNIVYFQSGGPTSVINASLFGLIKAAKADPNVDKIYGALYGVEGLINDNLVDLRQEDEEQLKLLLQTPGAALGSARRKLSNDQTFVFAKIKETMEKHGLNVIFVNGGNDSMDTCNLLHEYFKETGTQVLGIPKTVDNDLALTDHCLGFASGARAIINEVKAIAIDSDSYPVGRITLIEMMGRDTGWLPASTALIEDRYSPDLIYVPEMGFDVELFLEQVEEVYRRNKRALVVLPELLALPREQESVDAFGHVLGEGSVHQLAAIVNQRLHITTRSIGLSLLVRANPFNVAKSDQNEAIQMSKYMLESAELGVSGKIGCIRRVSNHPYRSEFFLVDAPEIANKVRYLPEEWILGPGKLNKDAIKEYLEPLLEETTYVQLENGQIKSAHLTLKKANA